MLNRIVWHAHWMSWLTIKQSNSWINISTDLQRLQQCHTVQRGALRSCWLLFWHRTERGQREREREREGTGPLEGGRGWVGWGNLALSHKPPIVQHPQNTHTHARARTHTYTHTCFKGNQVGSVSTVKFFLPISLLTGFPRDWKAMQLKVFVNFYDNL